MWMRKCLPLWMQSWVNLAKQLRTRREKDLVSSIQRCAQDPVLTVSDLEYVLLRLHLSIDAHRKKKKG